MSKLDGFLDSVLGVFFQKEKYAFYLLLIVIFGFVIRIIAAVNLGMGADDAHFAAHAINFIASGKLETWDQSTSLWYLVTDVFYKILGTSQLASRLAAVIFGSLSIVVVFLVSREFFNERTSLIAALLLALSPFAIKNMLSEMDSFVLFFIMLGVYFFLIGLKSDKTKFYAISGVFFGLGLMTKLYTPFFILSIIIYAFYINKKKTGNIIDKKILKKLLVFLVIAGIFAIPALTHNYLLYKEKGFTDFIVSNTLGIGKDKAAQYYSWAAGWDKSPDYWGVFFGNSIHTPETKLPGFMTSLSFILFSDPIVFVFGLLGLIFLFKRNREYFVFFFAMFIFLFVYLTAFIPLSKHYLFVLIILIPPAAFSLDGLIRFMQKKIRIRLRYFLIFLALVYLVLLGFHTAYVMNHVYGKAASNQLMLYKEESMNKDSLIVLDGRIYRGTITWMFNDRHYIEGGLLNQLLSEQEKLSGEYLNIQVYYVECVKDDCGWGTIQAQPEFNQTMEELTEIFKNSSQSSINIKDIKDEKYYFPFFHNQGADYYSVYKRNVALKADTLKLADATHSLFLYPLRYDERISVMFDDIYQENAFDSLLYRTSRLIQYIGIFLTFLSILMVLYFIIKISKKNE